MKFFFCVGVPVSEVNFKYLRLDFKFFLNYP